MNGPESHIPRHTLEEEREKLSLEMGRLFRAWEELNQELGDLRKDIDLASSLKQDGAWLLDFLTELVRRYQEVNARIDTIKAEYRELQSEETLLALRYEISMCEATLENARLQKNQFSKSIDTLVQKISKIIEKQGYDLLGGEVRKQISRCLNECARLHQEEKIASTFIPFLEQRLRTLQQQEIEMLRTLIEKS